MATLHERFKALREAMTWSWADVDRITGRKNARTNITKRVPAWAHLAIEAHETYEPRLQLHVIDAINQTEDSPGNSIELTFAPGSFILSSKRLRLEGLIEQLASLYPYSVQETTGRFRFSLIDQQDQKKTILQMGEESKVMF
jgi:hypothetical protein